MMHLLVPLDGSPFSECVLPRIAALFKPERYRVTLLRVGALPAEPALLEHVGSFGRLEPVTSVRTALEDTDERERSLQAERYRATCERSCDDLKDSLADAKTQLETAGFEVTCAARLGEASEEISRFAENKHIDLIAMSTHARRGIPRALLGSVAASVLRRADVPVMMFRPETET